MEYQIDPLTPEQIRHRALEEYDACMQNLRFEGEAAASRIYQQAILRLLDILETLYDDIAIFQNTVTEVLPAEFGADPSLRFSDWASALRLAPLRMIEKGMPDTEVLDPRYIDKAFMIALDDTGAHSDACYTGAEETSEYCQSCVSAVVCPSKAACYTALQLIDMLSSHVAFSELLGDTRQAGRGHILIAKVMSELGDNQLMPAKDITYTAQTLMNRALRRNYSS